MLVRGASKQSVITARRAVFGVRFSFVKDPVPACCRNKKEQPHALAICSTLAWASETGPMRSICRKQKRELVGGKRYRAAFRNCLQNINSCLVCAIDSGCHCRWHLNDAEAQSRSGRRPVLLIILSCGVCQASWRRSDALVRHHASLTDINDTWILWASTGDPFLPSHNPARCRFSATESGASHYCKQPTCPYACSAYEARVTNRSNVRFWIAGYSNAR